MNVCTAQVFPLHPDDSHLLWLLVMLLTSELNLVSVISSVSGCSDGQHSSELTSRQTLYLFFLDELKETEVCDDLFLHGSCPCCIKLVLKM